MGKVWLNWKRPKTMFIIALALMMLSPVFFSLEVNAQTQTDYYYTKTFQWDYAGDNWEWNLTISKSLYDEYKSVSVSRRTRNGPAGYGFLTTTDDYYLRLLAEKINETTTNQGFGSYDKVSFVLAFVQSLPYTADNVTSGYDEYPRFPVETLVDEGGDCEDTSILFASLTILLGYGTVYINPPNHYAVGILGDNLQGVYWTHNNQTYYYCETTGTGFKIGQVPDEFKNQKAYIYDIDPARQYVPSYRVLPSDQPIQSGAPSPTTTSPTIEPVSFATLFSQPVFLILITIVIAFSVVAVIFSAKKSRRSTIDEQSYPEPLTSQTSITFPEEAKFCIFCGERNESYAMFCEKCGKKIG